MDHRNWKFGARALKGEARELAIAQIRAGHDLKNKLCELELQRRKQWDDLVREKCPGLKELDESIAAMEKQIDEAIDAHRRESSRLGKRRPTPKAVADWKAHLCEMRQSRKVIAGKLSDEDRRLLGMAHKQAANETYNAASCHWGTRLKSFEACEDYGKGTPPSFKRWNGKGSLSVQIQKGATWERLTKLKPGVGQFRIEDTGQRMLRVWFRIGNKEWLPVDCIFHRRPHPRALIKWVSLHLEQVGPTERWSLVMSLAIPSEEMPIRSGVLGLDVGFRYRSDNTVLAATWHDGSESGEVRLNVGQWQTVETIQSDRSVAFNEAKAMLVSWLTNELECPQWLKEATSHIHMWKGASRLARLVNQWQRFDGDEEIYTALRKWRNKDRKKWHCECHLRDQLQAGRKDMYRKFAAWAAGRYRAVAIEDVQIVKLTQCDKSQDDRTMADSTRKNANRAAVGELLECLMNAMPVVKIDAAYTSKTCHQCGKIDHELGKEKWHTCQHCGAEWDRDENAAQNIRSRGIVELSRLEMLGSVIRKGVVKEKTEGASLTRAQKKMAARDAANKRKRENVL